MNLPHQHVGSLEAVSIVGVQADGSDITAIEDLIHMHGPNDWNQVPEEAIRKHLAGIATGTTRAIFAFSKLKQLTVGVVTYEIGHRFPQYQPAGRIVASHGYVAEAVVHTDFVGSGIGSFLLVSAIQDLTNDGMREVYATRHADNFPSKRMMEKAGLILVDEFDHPDKWTTGSRRTAVMRYTGV